MRIILTGTEYEHLKKYAYSINKEMANSIAKEAIASKLVTYSDKTIKNDNVTIVEHEITIDHYYLVDMLSESRKFAEIVAPLIRSAVAAFRHFSDRLDVITTRHKMKFKTVEDIKAENDEAKDK